jgi:hypothetical protein
MPYRECHPYESLKCHMPVKSIAEDGDLVVRCRTDERKDAPRIWIGNKSASSISTKGNNPKNRIGVYAHQPSFGIWFKIFLTSICIATLWIPGCFRE